MEKMKVVILGGGESGVGAAILAKTKGLPNLSRKRNFNIWRIIQIDGGRVGRGQMQSRIKIWKKHTRQMFKR